MAEMLPFGKIEQGGQWMISRQNRAACPRYGCGARREHVAQRAREPIQLPNNNVPGAQVSEAGRPQPLT